MPRLAACSVIDVARAGFDWEVEDLRATCCHISYGSVDGFGTTRTQRRVCPGICVLRFRTSARGPPRLRIWFCLLTGFLCASLRAVRCRSLLRLSTQRGLLPHRSIVQQMGRRYGKHRHLLVTCLACVRFVGVHKRVLGSTRLRWFL